MCIHFKKIATNFRDFENILKFFKKPLLMNSKSTHFSHRSLMLVCPSNPASSRNALTLCCACVSGPDFAHFGQATEEKLSRTFLAASIWRLSLSANLPDMPKLSSPPSPAGAAHKANNGSTGSVKLVIPYLRNTSRSFVLVVCKVWRKL